MVTASRTAALVSLARTGDSAAFADLVEGLAPTLARVASAITGNEADAADAIQDALTIAWQQMPRLRDPDRFRPWLTRILVNECRHLVNARRGSAVRQLPVDSSAAVAKGSLEDEVLDGITLERAFERLNGDERTVLVLHYMQQSTVEEMATVLRLRPGTVKSRLFAARRALEKALALEDEDDRH